MNWWSWAFKFIGIGWYVAFSLLAPTFLGLWLGGKVWALLGLLLGTVLAFYGLYAMLVKPQLRGQDGKGKGK